jgi:hypothetical protein
MTSIGYDWLRLATIGYDWLRLATIGYDWLRQAIQTLIFNHLPMSKPNPFAAV